MSSIALLRLSNSAPESRFFSNIERYRNRGFVLFIDDFGFVDFQPAQL